MNNKCCGCDKTNFECKESDIVCQTCYNKIKSGHYLSVNDIRIENGLIKEDIINKPNHYHDIGVDPITIGESILTREEMNGFYKMNMIKYWYRAGKKDGNSKEQDLKKYEFYRKKLEENN